MGVGLIILCSLHFAMVIFSFKDCCQLLSVRLRGLAFLVEALELTALEEIEQRTTEADS